MDDFVQVDGPSLHVQNCSDLMAQADWLGPKVSEWPAM